jgi:hypothetical protein
MEMYSMPMTDECRRFLDNNFDLGNYHGLKNYSIKQWEVLFVLRLHFLLVPELTNKLRNRTRLNEFFSDPIDISYWDDELITKVKNPWSPIHEFNVLDYWYLTKQKLLLSDCFKDLENDLQQYLRLSKPNDQRTPYTFINDHLPKQEVKHWEDEELNRDTRLKIKRGLRNNISVDITVDLANSDEVLRNAFEEWLADRRASDQKFYRFAPRKKAFGKSDITKWVQYKTLQCLDLRCAGLFFDCNLSDTEMVHYLFREHRDQGQIIDDKSRMRAINGHTNNMLKVSSFLALRNQ